MSGQADRPALAGGGLQLLATRIAAIPALLAEVQRQILADAVVALATAPRFVVTGGGLSEGPARVLTALLNRGGRPARFVPQSSFATPTLCHPDPQAVLLLFSQGLAPNAQLPLAHHRAFAGCLVFTAIGRPTPSEPTDALLPRLRQRLEREGVTFWQHPPAEEGQLLLRVAGPAAALACAGRFARLVSRQPAALSPTALAAAYTSALSHGVDLFGDAPRAIGIIAGELLGELAMPLRWKLLEGLRVADPPVWDLLQVVHGPLQAFHPLPQTLLSLERADAPDERLLVDRLATLLDPSRHRLLRFPVSGDPATALLLLDAQLNAALLATLARHPLDLDRWPQQGRDGALYGIAPATLGLPGWSEQPPRAPVGHDKKVSMKAKRYRCTICEHIYDPATGDPNSGIPPGTPFENLPAEWSCPECGALKADFEPLDD